MINLIFLNSQGFFCLTDRVCSKRNLSPSRFVRSFWFLNASSREPPTEYREEQNKSCIFEFPAFLLPTNLKHPMHSPCVTELSKVFLLDPVQVVKLQKFSFPSLKFQPMSSFWLIPPEPKPLFHEQMQRITIHNSLAITPTSTNGKLLTFLPLLTFEEP